VIVVVDDQALVGVAVSVMVVVTGDITVLVAVGVSAAICVKVCAAVVAIKFDVAAPVWSTAFGKMYVW